MRRFWFYLGLIGRYLGLFVTVGVLASAALALVPDVRAPGPFMDRWQENLRVFLLFDYFAIDPNRGFSVWDVLLAASWRTGTLLLGALAFSLGPALILSLRIEQSRNPRISRVTAQVLRSLSNLPVLIWAILFMLVAFQFAGIVPVFSQIREGAGAAVAAAVILPILALVLGDGALGSTLDRFQARARDIGRSETMLAVRARGLRQGRFLVRSMVPDVVDEAASKATLFLSGAIVIEVIFEWQGLGWRIWQALGSVKDYPVILGCVTVVMALVLGAHLLRDVLRAAALPHLR
ncbi:MAG: hypothetical protein EA422_03630 [Gemmatimonadales bacterium]|nr:MAG: hypothetical protein EA422_03630 [Gemmatimonadales bacterium]